jgi:hypothetical protein
MLPGPICGPAFTTAAGAPCRDGGAAMAAAIIALAGFAVLRVGPGCAKLVDIEGWTGAGIRHMGGCARQTCLSKCKSCFGSVIILIPISEYPSDEFRTDQIWN